MVNDATSMRKIDSVIELASSALIIRQGPGLLYVATAEKVGTKDINYKIYL